MYPLKFKPVYKERLWGGTKLNTVLNKDIPGEGIGESWELSGVEGDVSVVANGAFAGSTLTELIDREKDCLLGKKVYSKFGETFPILVKFIDARQDLSIQVHPNDMLAAQRHKSFGKTEMWYIMQADKDARLIVGFNRDVSRAEYEEHLAHNTLEKLLNYEKVAEGDTFFINTGKIHAIGGGIMLAEIQQTSDITYRVYDWNRKDKNGNTRELHTEMALDAIDYDRKDDFKVIYKQDKNTPHTMVESPYFTTNYIALEGVLQLDLSQLDSFSIYLCVEGEVQIANTEGSELLKKGETALVSAATEKLELRAKKAKVLQVHL
ncbi:type I phosphomannose isomerase catalytic subunit [Ascidiimonas aurantiaca]|uniref:type I phosphomannose isomerase catalytic subunit n=1 Tax=Ascidiimonas aurantiaca TaxID=1685432 RepID=UPI0030EDF0DF